MSPWPLFLAQINRAAPPPGPALAEAPRPAPRPRKPPVISAGAAEASRRALASSRAKRVAALTAREGNLRQRLRDLIAARPGLYYPGIAHLLITETPALPPERVAKVLRGMIDEFRRTGTRGHYRYYPGGE